MSGPNAPLAPATAAHAPIARPRSVGLWKMFVRSDNVDGMISAAPIPMNARVTTSMPADVANADVAEPMQKIARPVLSAPRRPNRSPRLPAVSNSPANTRV
jgi:hypothetical protein